MIPRTNYIQRLYTAIRRSPVVALLGPRQCGKTTLARMIAQETASTYFDLESYQDAARLQNPELALAAVQGLVIIDEIQRMPALLKTPRSKLRGISKVRNLVCDEELFGSPLAYPAASYGECALLFFSMYSVY